MSATDSLSTALVYQSVNKAVFDAVPFSATRILDVGCGGGDFGGRLKMKNECHVTGITFSHHEAALAAQRLDAVITMDLNQPDLESLGKFDCIVCSHVLEHLCCPEHLLRALLESSVHKDTTLIVALPNVLFYKQRLQFLCGRFRYTVGGIMDQTHYRFYDWTSAAQLIENAGFQLIKRQSDGIFPFSRLLGPLRMKMDQLALRLFPGLFGAQFIFVARRR